jgi:hypothetical protein
MPLFPLGTVLFPGALLPLQLFELRYLQMIGECERQGTGFGVVTLTQGREVHRLPRHPRLPGQLPGSAPGADDLGAERRVHRCRVAGLRQG